MKKKLKIFLATLFVLPAMLLSACEFGAPSSINVNSLEPQLREIYEEYQQSGGTLSYEEWLASIKGEKGDKGDKGDQGEQGPAGPQGSQGPQGVPGQDGANGRDGVDGKDGTNGRDGVDGKDGTNGQDGQTPYIGNNGNWWIGTTDTGIPATGPAGQNGKDGTNGTNGTNGRDGVDGQDGQTPYIGSNGNWWIGSTDTGVAAQGPQGIPGQNGTNGTNGTNGQNGQDGRDGVDGKDGIDGLTPYIGSNGNWWIGSTDTGVAAQGPQGTPGQNGTNGTNGTNGQDGHDGADGKDGADGLTPYIGSNGNWWIGNTDTGVAAQGPQGLPGQNGHDGADGQNGKDGADGKDGKDGVSIVNTSIDANGDLIITYSDGTTYNAGHVYDAQIDTKYTIKFYVNGVLYTSVEANNGSPISKPTDPEERCKKFVGWFDENGDKWVFNAFTVNKDLSLYAKFENNHNFNQKINSNEYCIVKETCETSGLYYYSCECGECGTEIYQISPKGHFLIDGRCYHGCSQNICDLLEFNLGLDYLRENNSDYASFYYFIYQHLWDVYLNKPTSLENISINLIFGMSFEEAVVVASKVILDNPLFYFANTSFTYDPVNNLLLIDVPDEYKTLSERTRIQDEIDQFLMDCPIGFEEDPIDKLTKIHDYINYRVDYEYDSNGVPSMEAHAHNIVGVVESTGAVCEGYSKSFQLLCTYYDIPCYVVTGKAYDVENHAWNLVQIDGEWYWCDLTWDDLEFPILLNNSASGNNDFFNARYQHFLVSDKDFLVTHTVATVFSEDNIPFLYDLPSRAKKDYFETHTRSEYAIFEVAGISYQMVDTYSVSVFNINVEGEAVIPSTVEYESNVYDVVAIGTYFTGKKKFEDSDTLYSLIDCSYPVVEPKVKSIFIPESVKTIYGGSLTSMGNSFDKAFQVRHHQNHLQSINVDSNNKNFCSIDGVLYSKDKTALIAYPFEKDSETFVLDDSTLYGDPQVFNGVYSRLKNIYIGSNFFGLDCIHGISNYMRLNGTKMHIDEENPYFYVYDGLVYLLNSGITSFVDYGDISIATITGVADADQESYTLLDCVEKNGVEYHVVGPYVGGFADFGNNHLYGIQGTTFNWLTSATSFDIQNSIFEFYMGCLYFDNNVIYVSPEVKELVIDTAHFTSIYNDAFSNCNNVEKITICEGITSIQSQAFLNCQKLKTIEIPHSVVEIGHSIIAHCSMLETIVYNGTMEEWENIAKNEDWHGYEDNIIVRCLDGDLPARQTYFS